MYISDGLFVSVCVVGLRLIHAGGTAVWKLIPCLARTGTLDPLRACTRLEVLDFNGNSLQGMLERAAVY
jgi:hypothetical protein